MIAPDLGNRDPVLLTQVQGDVCRAGWNIQIKRTPHLPELHPLGHRFEMVNRFGRLDLDDAMQPPCSCGAGKHQVRVHQVRAGAHAGPLAFIFDIDLDQMSPSQAGLKQPNHTVVFELFSDRPQ